METVGNLSFLSALLPFAAIIFIITVGVVLLNQQFQKNLFRQKLKQEELKNKHQRQLLSSSIQVQEQERKRIAQDLHDEMGATLSIIRMNLMQIEKFKTENREIKIEDLQNVRNLTENALASMRKISHDLMPPQLERFGLVKTLEAVANQVNNANELSLTIKVDNDFTQLNWHLSLGLYRILMELINNTIKHAHANEILIELKINGQTVNCQYTDNGRGIKTANLEEGLGYQSIVGRVNSLAGSISIGNITEGGFRAFINVPLTHN